MNDFTRPWHAHYPKGLSPAGEYPDIPLWGLLANSAQRFPGKTALIDGERRLTYEELWGMVERAAALLGHVSEASTGRPVIAGTLQPPRVMLWLPNVAEFVTAYYGALRAGCIVSAASPALAPDEFSAQLADVQPAAVVTTDSRSATARAALDAAKLTGVHVQLIETMESNARTLPAAHALPALDASPALSMRDAIAVLQYTSGTTGTAKGAMMSHGNLVANALQNARWFGWTENDINLAVLPLCHTWGMCCCLNSTFAVGGTLAMLDVSAGFDPQAVMTAVSHTRASILYGSATMLHRLADVGNAVAAWLSSLRHVKAGAMLSQGDLKRRWDALCPNAPLQQGYGLTEASPECHNNPPTRPKQGTVGVPMQDTDCRIADADDPAKTLETGQEGEVLLRGPQVTAGYWNRPDATAVALVNGWLRTGDIGRMDDEGYLTIVDRKKDLLKFRGYSVSPNAIEECLLRHASVKECVVVGRIDERDGEAPVAFMVLDSGAVRGAALTASLRDHCKAHLAKYEMPRAFRYVDAIPKNHVGKPLRRVLRDQVNSSVPATTVKQSE